MKLPVKGQRGLIVECNAPACLFACLLVEERSFAETLNA